MNDNLHVRIANVAKNAVFVANRAICERDERKNGVGVMKDISQMSNEELLRAIDVCVETGTNLTSHGQADDYLVGSLKMAQVYREEIKRREKSRERGELV